MPKQLYDRCPTVKTWREEIIKQNLAKFSEEEKSAILLFFTKLELEDHKLRFDGLNLINKEHNFLGFMVSKGTLGYD